MGQAIPDRRPLVVATVAAAYAALLCLAFLQVVKGNKAFGWDTLSQYWPDLVQVSRGDWQPYHLGGYSALHDPQIGLYSPINWLLSGLGSAAWVSQFRVFLYLWLGGMSMFLLCRRVSLPSMAAFVAGAVFIFAAPTMVNKNSALLWPVACVPLCLWAFDRLLCHASLGSGAVLALCAWCLTSAGNPPSLFYSLILMTVLGVGLLVHRKAFSAQVGLALGAALVLTLLLSAPLVLHAQSIEWSARANAGAQFALSSPMLWTDLGEFLVPATDAHWMRDIYCGAAVLALALIGTAIGGRERRALRIACALGACLCLLLALGKNGHLLPWLVDNVPIFEKFRLSYRYKAVLPIPIALLAAMGLTALLQVTSYRRHVCAGLCVVVLGMVLWVSQGHTKLPDELLEANRASLTFSCLALLALAVMAYVPRLRLWLSPVVMFLVLADLWSAGEPKREILQGWPNIESYQEQWHKLDGISERTARYIDVSRSSFASRNWGTFTRWRNFGGYGALPNRLAEHAAIGNVARRQPAILGHFNVRWIKRHASARGLGKSARPDIYEVVDAAPIFRVYFSGEVMPFAKVITTLSRTTPSGLDRALLDRALPHASTGRPPVDGALQRFASDEVVVSVEIESRGIGVLAENYQEGWVAYVNGQRQPVFRVNGLSRGVLLPPGRSTVEFRFEPKRADAIKTIFFIGFVLLLVAGFVSLLRLSGLGNEPV